MRHLLIVCQTRPMAGMSTPININVPVFGINYFAIPAIFCQARAVFRPLHPFNGMNSLDPGQ
jgi:hypothetical protein